MDASDTDDQDMMGEQDKILEMFQRQYRQEAELRRRRIEEL